MPNVDLPLWSLPLLAIAALVGVGATAVSEWWNRKLAQRDVAARSRERGKRL